ncbi:calcium-binding protein, partial [Vibrio parahaemolyticus]|uniref:calcium-binding protein n=1 Tax=Vibrio parahaemolyticus TaxID=670 RepID=UPI002B1FF8F6
TIRIAKGTENEGSLTFPKWFVTNNSNSSYKVELFEFNDGTQLSWKEINELSVSKNNTGDSGDNIIIGEYGFENDIQGMEGNDTLIGNNLSDYINGGAGDDVIDGGYGKDSLIGGEGNDVLGNSSVTSDDY